LPERFSVSVQPVANDIFRSAIPAPKYLPEGVPPRSRTTTPLSRGFLRKATAKTRAPILTQNMSNDVVPRKEVPFGGRETKI